MSEPLTTHRIARHVRRATRTGLSRCHYCGQELHGTNSEIERLREDNRYLKESAQFFAELSERLNNELRRKQRT